MLERVSSFFAPITQSVQSSLTSSDLRQVARIEKIDELVEQLARAQGTPREILSPIQRYQEARAALSKEDLNAIANHPYTPLPSQPGESIGRFIPATRNLLQKVYCLRNRPAFNLFGENDETSPSLAENSIIPSWMRLGYGPAGGEPCHIAKQLQSEMESFFLCAGEPTVNSCVGRIAQERLREFEEDYIERNLSDCRRQLESTVREKVRSLQPQIIEDLAQKEARNLIKARNGDLFRSVAALGALGFIAMHGPFHHHARTFLTISVGTAIAVSSNRRLEMVADTAAEKVVEGIGHAVHNNFSDKVILGLGLLFPTMWMIAKIPVVGDLASFASGTGVSCIFGIYLWKLQRQEYAKHAPAIPHLDGGLQEVNANVRDELPVVGASNALTPQMKMLASSAKIALLGSFVLFYPMTTNGNLTFCTVLGAAGLASSSHAYNRAVDADVSRLMDYATLGMVASMCFLASAAFLPGYIAGFLTGRWADGPLNVDLENLCAPINTVIWFNRAVAFGSSVSLGNEIWRLQGGLHRRKMKSARITGSLLDPLRTWLHDKEPRGLEELRSCIQTLVNRFTSERRS